MDARGQAGQRRAGRALRFARRLAQLLACSLALTPAAHAADARYQRGWLLLQTENARTIRLARGAEKHEIRYAAWPKGSRGTEFRDMALLADGRLAVSVTAAMPLGEQSNAILYFEPGRPADPPEVLDTGAVICYQILQRGETLWCLGPEFAGLVRNQNYALIHQVTPHGVIPVVERKHLPKYEGRAAWLPSPAGDAALLPAGRDGLLAWLPNAGVIVSLEQEGMRLYDLPLDASRPSSVSVASGEDRRLYALLPLLAPGARESLTTPYGLFVLRRPGSTEWTRVLGTPSVARGTRLLAIEGREAVLVDRGRRVMRVGLGSE